MSLSATWNSISAQNVRTSEEKDLEEVHRAGKLFYDALPSNAQKEAHTLFQYLDRDRNGRVSKIELWQLLKGSRSSLHLDYLFDILDADKNGQLSFEECTTLYYLIQARLECDKCGLPVVGLFYTCISCWNAPPGHKNGTFNLCYNCYTSKVYVHAHQDFFDNYVAFKKLLDVTVKSQKLQCSVCGDIHDSNVPAFFGGGINHHITTREDGFGYVCEWCIARTCSGCGKTSSGPHRDAKPRQWLMDNLYCNTCGKAGNVTDRSAFFENFKRRCNDESIPQCENCSFKIRNEELFCPPKALKRSSTTLAGTATLAAAANNKNNNSRIVSSNNKSTGDPGNIIDFAKLVFTVIQTAQSHVGDNGPQCTLM